MKQPTRLRLLNGTVDEAAAAQEVTPTDEEPDCPPWFRERARQEWIRTTAELRAMHMLHSADRASLVGYCQAVEHYEEAVRLINGSAMLLRGRDGNTVKNPMLQVARDQAILMRLFAREFGLTPAARVGLTGEQVEMSEGERYLS